MEFLVQLASLGVSGICIFAIFKIGNILANSETVISPRRHSLIKMYMGTCIVIAILSLIGATIEQTYSKKDLAINIANVLESKSAHELRNPDPEIRDDLITLSKFLKEAGVQTNFYVQESNP